MRLFLILLLTFLLSSCSSVHHTINTEHNISILKYDVNTSYDDVNIRAIKYSDDMNISSDAVYRLLEESEFFKLLKLLVYYKQHNKIKDMIIVEYERRIYNHNKQNKPPWLGGLFSVF